MPTDDLTDDQIDAIVAYIEALGDVVAVKWHHLAGLSWRPAPSLARSACGGEPRGELHRLDRREPAPAVGDFGALDLTDGGRSFASSAPIRDIG